MVNKTELEVVKDNTALVAFNYGSDTGVGFEEIKSKDLSIPFLSVLQAMSPQVGEDNPKGARPGNLYNTVTKELIDGEKKGLGICPVHYEEAYVEWVPREKGGGFVSIHDSNSEIVKQALADQHGVYASKLILKNGNQLVQTRYIYALLLNETFDASTGFCVISFTGSKIKPSKDWFTAIYMLSNAKTRPPLFANRALLKMRQNSKV